MRLFFALWPPRETARALGAWAREAASLTGGRATAEESIHLTLAFLGEADPGKASAAARRVSAAAFELKIEECRYWKHNKIVWAGPLDAPPELKDLIERLHPGLKNAGFVLEERPFAAHVTLVRKAGQGANLPPLPQVRWPAREFVLVQSVPTGKGSRYDVVERFPLQ